MGSETNLVDEPIQIVAYQSGWPQQFEEEQRHLRPTFGANLVDLQHFGSTAVPGMWAKPIIDILIGLRRLPLSSEQRDKLAQLGYEYLGEAGVPGRVAFRKRTTPAFNLAVVSWGSELWRDNLLLRDFLRANPEAAQQYGQHKRELSAHGVLTLLAYSAHKAPLIAALLEQARPAQSTNHLPPGTRAWRGRSG